MTNLNSVFFIGDQKERLEKLRSNTAQITHIFLPSQPSDSNRNLHTNTYSVILSLTASQISERPTSLISRCKSATRISHLGSGYHLNRQHNLPRTNVLLRHRYHDLLPRNLSFAPYVAELKISGRTMNEQQPLVGLSNSRAVSIDSTSRPHYLVSLKRKLLLDEWMGEAAIGTRHTTLDSMVCRSLL